MGWVVWLTYWGLWVRADLRLIKLMFVWRFYCLLSYGCCFLEDVVCVGCLYGYLVGFYLMGWWVFCFGWTDCVVVWIWRDRCMFLFWWVLVLMICWVCDRD